MVAKPSSVEGKDAVSRILTVFEHGELSIGAGDSNADMSESEADELSAIGELRPGFCKRGRRSIGLSQYCGLVRVGGRVLEVLPKTQERQDAESSRGLFLRLLREAGPSQIFRHLDVDQRLHKSPLLEIFISAFFDEATKIIRGGLIRQYQSREDDLRVVRGRIDIDRQIVRLWNRPDRIACQFDDLTVDNQWNRFIKAALRSVRPWISSSVLIRRWTELMVVFDEVADRSLGLDNLRDTKLDRQAVRYQDVLSWIRWIFAILSPEVRGGQNEAPGLLFDMNLLFQMVVVSTLRRRNEPYAEIEVLSQHTGKHLANEVSGNSPFFSLRPDIVIEDEGKVVIVGDAKWKEPTLSAEGFLIPDGQDVYQMHSYSTAYQCGSLMLVYPCYSQTSGAKLTRFRLTGSLQATLRIVCVDLDCEPFVLRYLEPEIRHLRIA